ncbi:hypothetical protein [Streptomyces sp. NPDC047097]|uniref:hypothetical protein n=1 Tax=Streptomyces sp. NPDC047097 TaxID=3155260 RepID=UPI0034065DFE
MATIEHRYDVWYSLPGNPHHVRLGVGMERRSAARLIRSIRNDGAKATFTHTAAYTETVQQLCFGCLARPATYERDVDGYFCTMKCETDQCQWWASVNARYAI